MLRVLDAAGNRAREGLRVVEDYVRFVLDDRHLTDQLKRLRHDLAGLLGRLSLDERLSGPGNPIQRRHAPSGRLPSAGEKARPPC